MNTQWRHYRAKATSKPSAAAMRAQNYIEANGERILCPVLPYKTEAAAMAKARAFGGSHLAVYDIAGNGPRGWVVLGDSDGTGIYIVRGRVTPGETVKTVCVRS